MPVPQYDSAYPEPLAENTLGGQSAEDPYNAPQQPLDSYDSPPSESYAGQSLPEETHESESYGSPQAEVITYPGEYEYIPEQSVNSFETFANFDTDTSDPGQQHDTQDDNDTPATGPGPGAALQTLDDLDVVNLPQAPDDDDAPNIPQVPSSDTPDQTNPEQYLNTEPGAVNIVLNNPLDYSEAVTNFLDKMRGERIFFLVWLWANSIMAVTTFSADIVWRKDMCCVVNCKHQVAMKLWYGARWWIIFVRMNYYHCKK